MKDVINIKADPAVKRQAMKVAKELGMPLSVIINAYLKQFVRSRAVYFTATPQMSAALEKMLKPIEEDIKLGRNIVKTVASPEELDEYLSSL